MGCSVEGGEGAWIKQVEGWKERKWTGTNGVAGAGVQFLARAKQGLRKWNEEKLSWSLPFGGTSESDNGKAIF